MLRVRWLILSLAVGLGGGSMCASIAYAWYLHSPWRHETIVTDLKAATAMPVAIAALTPDGRRRGVFEALSIRIAAEGPPWVTCPRGRWQHATTSMLTFDNPSITIADRGWSTAHAGSICDALRRCCAEWPNVDRVEVRQLTLKVMGQRAQAWVGALDGTATLTTESIDFFGTARAWNSRPYDDGIDITARGEM